MSCEVAVIHVVPLIHDKSLFILSDCYTVCHQLSNVLGDISILVYIINLYSMYMSLVQNLQKSKQLILKRVYALDIPGYCT